MTVSFLAADSWPLPEDEVTGSLGSDTGRGYSPGLLFPESDEDVRMYLEGELIYYSGPDECGVPLNTGEAVIFQHDNGFRSLYMGVEIADGVTRRSFLLENDILGRARSLLFMIRDIKLSHYVNPLNLLPPMEDERAPVIREVRLYDGDRPVTVRNRMSLPAGEYSLYVNTGDVLSSSGELPPYEIQAFYLGDLAAERKFDFLNFIGGEFYLHGDEDAPWRELYAREDFIYLGQISLKTGQAVLDISVKDYYGNTRLLTYIFTVTP
jgi:hypothetical protein